MKGVHDIACLAALAATMLATGPAQAQTLSVGARNGQTIQPLLGLNVGPGPQGEAGNTDLTSAYQQRGVTLVRTHDYYGPLDMATLYPDRSKDPLQQASYNFTGVLDNVYQRSSDSVFSAIVDGGFEPYLRIGDSYNNVSPPGSTQLANWVQASVQVLKHYRQGQWGGFNNSFRFAEIWNEPDNTTFWPTGNTTEQFNQLYDQTAKALRAAFPTLKIGGPGWSPGGCLASAGQAKVRSLLDHVKAQGSPMDFMSFHVYGYDATSYATCAKFYRTELDNRGLGSVELHITEWNTPNGSASSTVGQLRYNAQGAAYMTAAWINLQANGVVQSTFYRGTDPAADAGEFYGIFYGDGRSKKVADAFSLWRDFTAYPHALQTGGAPSGTTVLAAEDSGGARAVLIANPQAGSTSIGLSFADGKTLADYWVSISSVTDAVSGLATSAMTGTTSATQVTVPAQSTVLVRLTPKANVFASSATASGGLSAHTVTLNATLAAADVGTAGSIHVAALIGSTWYAYNGRSWATWTTGPLPAVFQGDLPPAFSITPVAGQDLRGLSGTAIYIGYGSSVDEMLAARRYRLAYLVP